MIYITKPMWCVWVCCMFIASFAFAQPPHRDFDHEPPSKEVQQKMKELHKAFIADKLELTDQERKDFFPIFDKMKEEEKAMMKSMKKDFKALRKKTKKGNLTEAEANQLLDKMLEREEKKLTLHKKYLAQMRKVLPATKLVKLKHADRRFRGEVMRRFKGKRKGKRGEFPNRPPHRED